MLIHIIFPPWRICCSVGAARGCLLMLSNSQRTNANLSKSAAKVCKIFEITKYFVLTIVFFGTLIIACCFCKCFIHSIYILFKNFQ